MTLRMTLGTADGGEIAARDPLAALGLGPEGQARIGRHQRAIDDDLQPEVREDVHDRAGHRPPVGAHRRRAQRLLGRRQQIAPHRAGHLEHAAEQARLGALAQQHVAVLAQGDEGEADALRALGALQPQRQRRGDALRARRRNRDCTGQTRHDGRRGVQMPAPRSIIACAKSPARRGGVSVAARRFNSGFAAGQRLAHGEQARDHALDVAVDRRCGLAKCDRGDGRRGVGADARQLLQLGDGRRKLAAQILGNRDGALVQVAGAAVVAEPRPGGEHVVERRRGQRLDGRPAGEEAQIEGDDGFDRRLLQHDLAEPDAVGVGALARRHAPRQVTALLVIPSEQRVDRVRAGRPERQLLSRNSSQGIISRRPRIDPPMVSVE